jgi:hypothetical protein
VFDFNRWGVENVPESPIISWRGGKFEAIAEKYNVVFLDFNISDDIFEEYVDVTVSL